MSGKVTLVGAGPAGDLITLRGLRAVKRGDVLVCDDLIDQLFLSCAKSDCEIIYVGKRHGKHSKKQEEISRLLIDKAREGKWVIRLKGGDSFVFGRGGEEILALMEAGIDCEVIPGVSSAIAVPESMGIPVTHRGMAQSLTIVTGHTATDKKENYQALAALQGTLVFLMSIYTINEITAELIRAGKPGSVPAAVLSRGFSGREERIDGTLETIAKLARNAKTPGILVVGEVAAIHLMTTIPEPLGGLRIAVAGTRHFTDKLQETLGERGAWVSAWPVIETVPREDSLAGATSVPPADMEQYRWLVFTSANGVRIFMEILARKAYDLRKLAAHKIACIGEGTAKALAAYGLYADFIPSVYTAQVLGSELARHIQPGDKVLILRASNGSKLLTEELNAAGVIYRDDPLYETRPVILDRGGQIQIDADYLVLGSAMGARTFLESYFVSPDTKIVCIGSVTKQEVEQYRKVDIVAENHSAEGICQAIVAFREHLPVE